MPTNRRWGLVKTPQREQQLEELGDYTGLEGFSKIIDYLLDTHVERTIYIRYVGVLHGKTNLRQKFEALDRTTESPSPR